MNSKPKLGWMLVGAVVGCAATYAVMEARQAEAEREWLASLPPPPPRPKPNCSPEGIKKLAAELYLPKRGHAGFGPEIDDLVHCGTAAMPEMLNILERDDHEESARYDAKAALLGIMQRRFGIDDDTPPDDEKRKQLTRWHDEHGRFGHDLPVEERRKLVARWREWLQRNFDNHEG